MNLILPKLKNIFLNFLKSEFFIISVFILSIIGPIFFIKGSVFLLDYNYGYCFDGSFLSGMHLYSFNIIDLFYRINSFVFGCEFSVRLFIFVSLFIFCYSFYKLSFVFAKNKILSLIVSFISLVTPFIYDRLGIGEIHIILSAGFLVLSVSYILKLFIDREEFDKNFDKNIFLSCIYYSLSFLASPHFIFIFIFYIPLIIYLFYKKNILFKKFLFLSFCSLFIFVFVNFNLLIGSSNKIYRLYVNNINLNNSDSILPIGDNFGEILFNSLNLSNHFVEKAIYNYKSLVYEYPKVLSVGSFIIFFICFLIGVYLLVKDNKKNKYIYYLLFLFLISVVFSFGLSDTIFCDFNKFLIDNIPFYKSMRESSKWGVSLMIIYAVFISSFLDYIYKNLKGFVKYFLLFIFCLISIFRAPYLFFNLNRQLDSYIRPINNHLFAAKEFLDNDNIYNDRIIVLPWIEYILPDFLNSNINDANVYSLSNHLSNFFSLNSYDFFNVNKTPSRFIDNDLIAINKVTSYNNYFINYLKSLNFKYIVFIKASYPNVNNVNYKMLKGNSSLMLELDNGSVSVFKIIK